MTLNKTTLRRLAFGFSFGTVVMGVIFMLCHVMDGWSNDPYSRSADIMLGAGLLATGMARPCDRLSIPLGLVLLLIGNTWYPLDAILVVALVIWVIMALIMALITALAKRSARKAA